MATVRRLLSSTWLWAIFPTLVAFYLVNPVQPREQASLSSRFLDPNIHVHYIDLNGDGITEQIQAKPGAPLNGIPVMDNDGGIHDQWNLPDDFEPNISGLFFGDFDHDHRKEIYVFTVKSDSLFLSINEFFDTPGTHINRFFIAKVALVEGHVNSNVQPFGFWDTNGDGYHEFYFKVSTGFGLWPRYCYYLDLVHRQLKQSPLTGINFNQAAFSDLDNDSIPEIISNISSPGNHHMPTPYSDYSSWLMVLNDSLGFKFPPVEFPGFGGRLDVTTIRHDSVNQLVVLYNFKGANRAVHPPSIMLYSPNGELLRERPLSDFNLEAASLGNSVGEISREIVLTANPMLWLNEKLELVRSADLPFKTAFYSHRTDIDGDEQPEWLLYSGEERKLLIANNELTRRHELTVDLPEQDWEVSTIITSAGERALSIQSGALSHIIQIRSNPNYWYSYWKYGGIYLCFFLLIWLTRKVTTNQIEKKAALNQRLLQLQLQSVKSQLDPHFTFNALNSISSMLYLDDRKAAYDAMNIFTHLLRQLLNDADRIFRSLREEIEFVMHYLDLEKIRFGTKFSYAVEIAENVTQQEQVPKMILQTFVENAIKHGLLPREEGGRLEIRINRSEQDLYITVEDNGIGRAKAAEQTSPTRRGLLINKEFFQILSQMGKRPIRYTITDLVDSGGAACGTRVDVVIPVG